MTVGELSLDSATRIAELSLTQARDANVPPLTVVVLDAAGQLVTALRQDGASMFRFDVALGKAWGAVAMGTSSRDLALRAGGNPNFYASLAATAHGRFIPQPGAVLVRSEDGTVLGSVGASGGTGDQDEMCCLSGVLAAGYKTEQGVEA